MTRNSSPRRLQIVIKDEESGEEVARADSVETMILLMAPDIMNAEGYRHILLGDAELSVEMLFDVFSNIADKIGRGTTLDLTDILDDRLLLEVTQGLPIQ